MTKFSWNKGVAGDWNAAANWLDNAVPNDPAADVVVGAAPVGSPGYYAVKIAAGTNDTVNSLDLASSTIGLEIDGTLTFAPGSAGALGREFQSSTVMINNGAVVNAGQVFAYVQTTGNVLFTGSNPIYLGWELQVVSGTATIDTASIGQYDAAHHTLFDGAFDALGTGRTVNFGGKLGGLAVDIETLTGPKPTPTQSYWTQLTYDDPGSQINEWNGTSYVPVESTLKLIENAAYVTVTNGRGYATANALTIGKDGVFEQAGGTLSTGGLTLLAGGLLIGGVSTSGSNSSTGQVSVTGAVANNGRIVAEGPGLVFHDAITGTGQITFNRVGALPGFGTPVGAAVAGRLEVGAVGSGQTVAMIGGDTLVLDAPAAFAGVVSGFATTDTIVVDSATAVTSATYAAGGNGAGTLTLSNGTATLGTIALTGSFAAGAFQVTAGTAANSYNLTVTSDVPVADPLFDANFYLSRNPDVAAAGVDPYQHYLAYGWKEGRDPSALFSDSYYLSHNPDVAAAGVNPLLHYEQHGWQEGRNPDALFDTNYYLAQNPDVAAAGIDPLLHFQASGAQGGRDPSLVFSDAKYLAANPDVAAAGVNPLAHYLAYGQSEGRMAFLSGGTAAADPLVDAAYYDKQLGATLIPTDAAGQRQAAASFDATGWQKGLNPDAFFDTSYYLSHNPDVAAAHLDPLQHYEQHGWTEGRDPSAQFSTAKYLAAYSDVKAAGVDPLLHYVEYGKAEGRAAFAA